jgi:hypothetical protein
MQIDHVGPIASLMSKSLPEKRGATKIAFHDPHVSEIHQTRQHPEPGHHLASVSRPELGSVLWMETLVSHGTDRLRAGQLSAHRPAYATGGPKCLHDARGD